MTNDNPKCPVCLTVQTGAHTCKRAKPSCEPCKHDYTTCWRSDNYGGTTRDSVLKKDYPTCPFCKPVEIRKDCQEGKVYGFNPDYMKKEVEPSSKHEPWCNWHKDNRLCSCKPVVCNVVEPSVEAIANEIISVTTDEATRFNKYKRDGATVYENDWLDLERRIAEALRKERNRK